MIMKQLLLFMLALAPIMASAQAPQVIKDGITYRCYDDGAYITGAGETVSGDIVIPETVTDEDGIEYNVSVIDENAFQDRAITSIVLPSTLTWIYEDAFQGCTSLTDVTLLGLTPPSANRDAFYGDAFTKVKIHVPTEALATYKADDYWKQFATIDDNVPVIGDGIAINATNFPDEAFRIFVGSKDIDTDQNGFLSDEEIAKVKEIDVENKGIKSLKGIEYFTELETLNCARNELKELDVTKNTKLMYLQTRNNQLTALDVTKNTELTNLYCHGNQLTALDVTKNTKLEVLGVWSNQLTSLDITKCIDLRVLSCTSNKLTSLDFSKSAKMQILHFSNNQLSSVNVSNMPDLKSLDCSSNPLGSLDVTKNPKLDTLACTNNQLTSLDISKNTQIVYLVAQNNELKTIDLTKHTKLKVVGLAYNQFTTIDVSKNTVLTEFYCHGNQLTSLDMSQHKALTTLHCPYNLLTSLTLAKDGVLSELLCLHNIIKEEAMSNLIASLPNQENGFFGVFDTDNITEEQNVCTTTQVAALKAKGWTAYHLYNDEFVPYAGSDPSVIDGIKLQSEETGTVYNLNGLRTNGSHKGIVIKNGKKYITK